MRILALSLAALIALGACERRDAPVAPLPPPEPIAVFATDELINIETAPTGIAFWTHPNVAFNAMMLVASETGIVAYNMENGDEVTRITDVDAGGVAVSYLGRGPEARGLAVIYDQTASAFAMHAIDNATRQFQAVPGEIPVRGVVRGFCFGRAADAHAPSLYIVQKSAISAYSFSVEDGIVKATTDDERPAPPDAADCVIGPDGRVIVGGEDGALWRLGVGDPEILINATVSEFAGIEGSRFLHAGESDPLTGGRIIMLDGADGAMQVFDAEDGHTLGAASMAATDEIEITGEVGVFAATGSNLGGIYRNGAVAIAYSANAQVIRLMPLNGIANGLALEVGLPDAPRGQIAPALPEGITLGGDFLPGE